MQVISCILRWVSDESKVIQCLRLVWCLRYFKWKTGGLVNRNRYSAWVCSQLLRSSGCKAYFDGQLCNFAIILLCRWMVFQIGHPHGCGPTGFAILTCSPKAKLGYSTMCDNRLSGPIAAVPEDEAQWKCLSRSSHFRQPRILPSAVWIVDG